MRTSIRKQITTALGNAGLRDWKSPEEMNQAKALYDVMVANDVDEPEISRGTRVRKKKPTATQEADAAFVETYAKKEPLEVQA